MRNRTLWAMALVALFVAELAHAEATDQCFPVDSMAQSTYWQEAIALKYPAMVTRIDGVGDRYELCAIIDLDVDDIGNLGLTRDQEAQANASAQARHNTRTLKQRSDAGEVRTLRAIAPASWTESQRTLILDLCLDGLAGE